MRVLITGAAGFIGSHLAERLESEGHEVHGLDNLETGRLENFPQAVELDIANRHMLYDYANTIAPELVIHCAASYSDPNRWHRDTDTNVTGTINVINLARHHRANLIYFQTALPAVSSYAISKIAAERYILISDVPSLIFRLANIYGPRNVSGPIPAFFKRLDAGQPCTVVDTTRDLVYIDDLVQCVLMALDMGRLGSFDVCTGRPVTIGRLYELVSDQFEQAPLAQVIEPPSDDVQPVTYVQNWLRGWRPTTPLETGVANAVRWYREHGVEQTYTHL